MMRFEDFIGGLEIECRKKLVNKLLRGNDTCCFSTEQYIDLHAREGALLGPPRHRLSTDTARLQIRTTGLAREIRPGVWYAEKMWEEWQDHARAEHESV